MKTILGINITRNRSKRSLRMDQTHCLKKVLERLHIRTEKHKKTDTPITGYDGLCPAGSAEECIAQRQYQQAIGSFMYAAIRTRHDIAFALNRLSQSLSDPAKHHATTLKGLLKYLRSTIDLGIAYWPDESSGSATLIGYSDSDYAADRVERKSTLGYVYMLAGGPISWASRKQKPVATLTTCTLIPFDQLLGRSTKVAGWILCHLTN